MWSPYWAKTYWDPEYWAPGTVVAPALVPPVAGPVVLRPRAVGRVRTVTSGPVDFVLGIEMGARGAVSASLQPVMGVPQTLVLVMAPPAAMVLGLDFRAAGQVEYADDEAVVGMLMEMWANGV